MPIKPFIAFDLGNVILPFDHMVACKKLGEICSIDPTYIYKRIIEEGIERDFELGLLSPAKFTQSCRNTLKIDSLKEDVLMEAWSDIFSLNEDVEKLIDELTDNSDLCLISNTNCWHFNFVLQNFPVVSKFSRRLLSYEIQRMKPDPAIFQYALRWVHNGQMKIFIDDIAENVKSAADVGFNAIHFSDVSSLRNSLRLLGLALN